MAPPHWSAPLLNIPSSMSKRTIRIPVEGDDDIGGRSVAVKRKLNALGENADFTFWISVLVRSANCLYNSLISKFKCRCIILVMAPPHWSAPLRSRCTNRLNPENNGGARNVALPINTPASCAVLCGLRQRGSRHASATHCFVHTICVV